MTAAASRTRKEYQPDSGPHIIRWRFAVDPVCGDRFATMAQLLADCRRTHSGQNPSNRIATNVSRPGIVDHLVTTPSTTAPSLRKASGPHVRHPDQRVTSRRCA